MKMGKKWSRTTSPNFPNITQYGSRYGGLCIVGTSCSLICDVTSDLAQSKLGHHHSNHWSLYQNCTKLFSTTIAVFYSEHADWGCQKIRFPFIDKFGVLYIKAREKHWSHWQIWYVMSWVEIQKIYIFWGCFCSAKGDEIMW